MQLPTREEVLHGPGTLDDAGVIRIPGSDHCIVQTVDFFPPIVDDPADFGRIAAANSLSDIYAMGGTPLSALNIVGFPAELPTSILSEILAGGAEKMVEANCALLGGHSVRDSEVKYGLAVTGTIDADRIMTNGAAEAGDLLVLTKGLGTGSVSTALNKQQADADVLAAATASMATLNAAAARVAIALDAHAVTDVTGFGLLGHLHEMLEGVGAEIDPSVIPIIPGAAELAAQGIVPGGSKRNLAHAKEFTDFGAAGSTIETLLSDAQTSGGLLIAVASDRADDLVAELSDAVQIGHLVTDHPGRVTIL